MPHPVCYFEIPVNDMGRAVAFYEAVFALKLERTEIDGNEMALFPEAVGTNAITGALARGASYVPSRQGTRIYFRTDSIDTTLERAVAAGGIVMYPKTSIGDLGWVAEFEDSEGNVIALHSPA